MDIRYEDGTWLLLMEDQDKHEPYDVYYKDACILQQVTGNQRFSLVCEEQRPLFRIHMRKRINWLKQRYLPQTGVVNFRDIGGYRNREGMQVRYDCFYRSAPLCNLQEEQIAFLNHLHIQHILDLRSAVEQQGKEDIPLAGAQYHAISGIAFDQGMDVQGNFDFANLMKQMDLSLLKGMMLQVYAKLPFANPAYQFLVQTLLKEEVPIVFHCSAGKDRTGFGAALILLLLDVDEEVILQDYLLSNHYRKEENAKIYAQLQGNQKDMEALMGVQEIYLKTAFAAIKERYGDYATYFKDEFGIDEASCKRLKKRYLYPINM